MRIVWREMVDANKKLSSLYSKGTTTTTIVVVVIIITIIIVIIILRLLRRCPAQPGDL